MHGCECCPQSSASIAPRQAAQFSRRVFLSAVATGALTACAPALKPRRVLEPLTAPPDVTARDIPLVDFHAHIQKRVSAEELVRHMDQAGVARMVLMALYYGDRSGAVNDGEGTDEQALSYARRSPGRFVPFVGMQRGLLVNRDRWIRPDSEASSLLLEAEWKLRSGEFFGMGEFMLRFYPYTTELGIAAVSDMDYPADSTLMRYFADLSGKYRVPVVIHCEAEPHTVEAMLRLLELHPEATVVWAHNCGRAGAGLIRDWLSRYPNLYADLGNMVSTGYGYGTYWPRRTPLMHLVMSGQGDIFPEMKTLFETFPDRFFIGNDLAHARAYVHHSYLSHRWRLFLSQLSAATARKIAFENAERLFRQSPTGLVR